MRPAESADSAGSAIVAVAAAPGRAGFVRDTLLPFLASAQADPSGLRAAAVVFVAAAILSVVGWAPLAVPPTLIGAFVPVGNCTSFTPASPQMYVCSAKVAALTLVGPLATMALMFVFRHQLTHWAGRLSPKLPAETRFLVAPLVATVIFTMSWASIHSSTASDMGILPQTIFPALIGLFTFATTRFGPALQQRLGRFFDLRDRFPLRTRVAASIAVPLLVSLAITAEQRVSETAMKEQLVVLISLCTGYLALAPRGGDLVSGVGQLLSARNRKS
jgi:hypothetical protein